jgi:hypothetical protein
MEPKAPFDFEAFKQEAIKGLYAGQPINSEKGIFAPLLNQLLEAALEGEMAAHLDGENVSRATAATEKPAKWLRVQPASLLCPLRGTAQAVSSRRSYPSVK